MNRAIFAHHHIHHVIFDTIYDTASIHRTISEDRFSSIRTVQPADRMLSMVRRLMFAPIMRTTIGLRTSKMSKKESVEARFM